MKSEDTKRIIKEIAEEEGLSEWAVGLIVRSQFEGVHEIITSAVPDDISTFKNVRLNAFCHFKVMPKMFKKYKNKKQNVIQYMNKKQLYNDNKK